MARGSVDELARRAEAAEGGADGAWSPSESTAHRDMLLRADAAFQYQLTADADASARCEDLSPSVSQTSSSNSNTSPYECPPTIKMALP